MIKKGKLLVISGPSGTGKGTVLKKLFQMRDDVCFSVSATSRKPREGEVNGVNYFFVTKDEFEKMIAEEKFLEYAQFCENYYGTPSEYVEKKLAEGKNVILEIEVLGAMQVKKKCPDAVMIFILPPSMEVLRQRLSDRGTESASVVEKRLAVAERELARADEYDYKVVNDIVDIAAQEIAAIIDNN